jgi:hypothetical protein
MPKIIEVPGQGQIEFPDSMGDAEIVAAIQKMSPAKPASPAVEDPGFVKGALVAAGRTFDRVGKGVQQMYYGARSAMHAPGLSDLIAGNPWDQKLDKLKQDAQSDDKYYAPLQKARPWTTGIGEALPSLAIPMGGGAGALAKLGRAAVGAAIPGALSYGSAEERAKAAAVGALGGAAGAGVGMGLTKALSPTAGAAISDTAQAAANRLGLNLTAAQRTQNPALVNLENYLARSPGSSGAMQTARTAQETALNTAAARSMGQTSNELSEGTFRAAKDGIGKEFQRLQGITSPKLGNDFFQTLATIDADNLARGAFKSKSVDSLINKSLDLAQQGNLSGKAYKEIRTQLTNEAEAAFKAGDATVGQAYKAVRSALDDAAKSSLSDADKKAWDMTRKQWAAYKTLTKSNVAEAGNVSPARVAAALRGRGDTLRTGQASGELSDIARIGEAVKGAQNPNSGANINQMLYGNPFTGIPLMAGNKLLQSTYTSRPVQRYLSNGLLNLSPNAEDLMQRAVLPVGAPLVGGLLGTQ